MLYIVHSGACYLTMRAIGPFMVHDKLGLHPASLHDRSLLTGDLRQLFRA